jgi:adenylate kinase family enzyme
VYREQTEPVIQWVKDRETDLVEIDATGDLDVITERAMKGLAA